MSEIIRREGVGEVVPVFDIIQRESVVGVVPESKILGGRKSENLQQFLQSFGGGVS